MVSEPSTGYICGFEVYTGDASGQSQVHAQELQDASKCIIPKKVAALAHGTATTSGEELQDASKSSCIVLGLLDSAQLLDMGHHVYFDNYYNSPNLIDLLYKRKTHACGTVRKN